MKDIDYEHFVLEGWSGGTGKNPDLRSLFIMTSGLAGETGEVMEEITAGSQEALLLELGDVYHYCVRLALAYDMISADLHDAANRKVEPIKNVSDLDRIAKEFVVYSGRASDLVKKHVRDGKDIVAPLKLALGGVISRLLGIGLHYGFGLVEIKRANVKKLMDRRMKSGVLGNGGQS